MAHLARLLRSPGLWILLVTVAVIAIIISLKPKPPRVQTPERAWPVQVREVQPQLLNPQLSLLGRVESPRTSTLTASIGATVDKVPAQEGEAVEEGELLLALDAQEAQLQLRQAEAELANLKAQIRQEQTRAEFDRQTLAQQQTLVAAARRTLEREQSLTQSNLTSEQRLDEARTSLAGAELSLISQRLIIANQQARLDALQAQLARAQALTDQAALDLARAEIRAPFPGIITAVSVSPGERVRIGDPILTLYALDALEIRAQLPQRWLPEVRQALQAGQLKAVAMAAGQRYPLRLERLSGQVNTGAGGIDALFRFAGDIGADLAVGRTLDILLELPGVSEVMSLPVSSLYGTNQVFEVIDNQLQSVFVELKGERFTANGQEILVQSQALKAGDNVITTQLPNAVSGLKVQIRNPETGSAGNGS